MVLAQTGNTVLLVDSTLREPANAKLFGTDTLIGSSITMAHADSPIELLAIPEVKNLYILPINPILSDPFGLFAPTQTPEVINILKNYASYILIVGSNLMSSPETLGLASRVDGLILVTPDIGLKRDEVDSLIKNAITYKWEIIGTVLVKIRTGLQPFRNQQRASLFGKLRKTINTVLVKIRSSLQHFRIQQMPIMFGKLRKTTSMVLVNIQTSLQPFRNQLRTFLFGIRGKILGKKPTVPEKEGAIKEPNDIKDQSL